MGRGRTSHKEVFCMRTPNDKQPADNLFVSPARSFRFLTQAYEASMSLELFWGSLDGWPDVCWLAAGLEKELRKAKREASLKLWRAVIRPFKDERKAGEYRWSIGGHVVASPY